MADDIVGAFQAIATGMCESLRRRRVFDAFRDQLRALEGARAQNVPLLPVAVGQLRGLLFAVEMLECWPAPEYRGRYQPRAMFILAQYQEGL
jgi:hypothetical protein